jgi:cytochrome c peroxidase
MNLRPAHRFMLVVGCVALVACTDQPAASTIAGPPRVSSNRASGGDVDPVIVALVRQMAAQRGIVRLESPPRVRPELVHLGQALIFDPILSGNRNIACTTCHLPAFSTGDGRALSIGEGGSGFGPARTHPTGVFIPRNAPPLFNLFAKKHLFWDGRVQVVNGQLQTPAGDKLTPAMKRVLEFGPASVLAMFPVTNRFEMRGQASSGNELAAIDDDDFAGIWAGLMRRIGSIPEYRALFEAAYPGTKFSDMNFAHASNAIGGFIVDKLSFNNTPWDRFMRGDDNALSPRQLDGAQTFLSLKCSICHTGATLSDQDFHNVAVAQIGPGEGDGASGHDDFGRMRVTGQEADRYRFATTPLRNVELTGPYGHDGSISSLRDFVAHYSESDLKLQNFDIMKVEPALRGTLQPTSSAILAQRDTLLTGVVFDNSIVDKLMDYMSALTDPDARDLSHLTPAHVPSKLDVPGGKK